MGTNFSKNHKKQKHQSISSGNQYPPIVQRTKFFSYLLVKLIIILLFALIK